jgi:hypothetical protein
MRSKQALSNFYRLYHDPTNADTKFVKNCIRGTIYLRLKQTAFVHLEDKNKLDKKLFKIQSYSFLCQWNDYRNLYINNTNNKRFATYSSVDSSIMHECSEDFQSEMDLLQWSAWKIRNKTRIKTPFFNFRIIFLIIGFIRNDEIVCSIQQI